MKAPFKRKAGFIALVSAVVISAILLTVAVTLSYSAFFVRSNILEGEYKNRSMALAEGCVDVALLKLANDPVYAGNETMAIGAENCTVRPILTSGTVKTIEARAMFQNSYTNLRVNANQATLAVISWEEVPKF